MLSQGSCNKVNSKKKGGSFMQSKEVRKWQDEEALKRYQLIAPLLDETIDEGKRIQMREEIAEKKLVGTRSTTV